MNLIVNTYPLTKFEGGLNLLHKADDGTIIWLESTATAALTGVLVRINRTQQQQQKKYLAVFKSVAHRRQKFSQPVFVDYT